MEITTLTGMKIAEFIEKTPFPKGPYYIEGCYSGSYFIEKLIAYDLQLKWKTNFSSDEIKLEGNSYIKKREEFKIHISPKSLGEKTFNLFVEATLGKKIKQNLLEKNFWIQKKSLVIEAKTEKELPATMKLGEKAEVIFLFTNTGNQTATDINIEVKQIEA